MAANIMKLLYIHFDFASVNSFTLIYCILLNKIFFGKYSIIPNKINTFALNLIRSKKPFELLYETNKSIHK